MKSPFLQIVGTVISLSALCLVTQPCLADELSSNTGAYGDFDLTANGHAFPQPATEYGAHGYAPNVTNGVATQPHIASATNSVATAATNSNSAAAGSNRPPQKSTKTSGQRLRGLPRAGMLPLDHTFGGYKPLPPTLLDSFVTAAAGNADLIYGDEGTTDLPPYNGFDESHRINSGIYNPLLTTGHESVLPDAWGYPN